MPTNARRTFVRHRSASEHARQEAILASFEDCDLCKALGEDDWIAFMAGPPYAPAEPITHAERVEYWKRNRTRAKTYVDANWPGHWSKFEADILKELERTSADKL